jgi:hypothetical protein
VPARSFDKDYAGSMRFFKHFWLEKRMKPAY